MIEIDSKYLSAVHKKQYTHIYYDKTIDHAEEMGIHVDGDKPKKLLEINRPSEQEEIKKYRLESYQPVTKSLSEKVINTVNKIFNPRLWEFKFPEMTTEDSLSKYLTEDYPIYRSIMNFITETFTSKDFSDANAAIVVMPQNFNIDETQLFEPIAYIYDSESLVDFEEDDYYTFVFGDVVKVFTTTQILQYQKNTREGEEKWDLIFEYTHDFGFVPVFRLGGIVKGKSYPYYYESWIRGILPHWNQVVQLTSDLQAAYMSHIYMDKWEYATECDNPRCEDGKVKLEILDGKEVIDTTTNCNVCLGTGKVSRGPYGVHTISRDSINPDAPLPTPPAGYIDKPIDIVDKVEDRIKDEEKRGLASINMEIVQMVGEDQSGVAKTIDREDLNSFLSRYSRHVFEYVLPNLILNIAAWRYGETMDVLKILPEISQPKDFNILNLDQLTTEYKDASNANVSDNYLQHIEREIVQSKFANNDFSRMKNDLIIRLQPYPGKTPDDLLTLHSLGEERWSIFMSLHMIKLVEMAIDKDKKFLEKTLEEQREIIQNLAKDAVGFVENPVSIPAESQSFVASEIANEEEAEAKARLKGSVGGVQGILQLQESVSRGLTDRSAAIELLDKIYGFDSATAEKILGTPKLNVPEIK